MSSSEDEFAARLRAAVEGAGASTTLDTGAVVRRSRHRARVRRGGAVAATLACVAAAAVAAPAALGALATTPAVAPASVGEGTSAAEVTAAGVPGVTVAEGAVAHEVDDERTVIDLGLDAWVPGERFFVTFAGASPNEVATDDVDLTFDVWAGDDADLATALETGTTPEPFTTGSDANRGYLVVRSADGAHELVVADMISFDDGPGPGDGEKLVLGAPSGDLYATEPFRTSSGDLVQSIDVAANPVRTGSGWAGNVYAVRVDATQDAVTPRFWAMDAPSGTLYCARACVAVWDGSEATLDPEPRTPSDLPMGDRGRIACVDALTAEAQEEGHERYVGDIAATCRVGAEVALEEATSTLNSWASERGEVASLSYGRGSPTTHGNSGAPDPQQAYTLLATCTRAVGADGGVAYRVLQGGVVIAEGEIACSSTIVEVPVPLTSTGPVTIDVPAVTDELDELEQFYATVLVDTDWTAAAGVTSSQG
ncbi:hypothetical protein CLV28_2044 [Sediminihabitans luteus]|uniref:Uncharacterized protein n=1 Tax=Sediminihabitans luteus TaxID=1138585 RepID=A0A2M9CE90_9CELL|nr:hypothetical protein [Sediminihabitans luteus]PJJ70213.1 hypothetical protein CLV28_2044 [Sediminihabitans luteus]GII97684.1 hypothetical protein Slu03_00620 [Sediminihabitans luteus]